MIMLAVRLAVGLTVRADREVFSQFDFHLVGIIGVVTVVIGVQWL